MKNLAAIVCGGVLLASIGAGQAQAQQFVRIGSGLAGTYPVFGAKLAELINKNVPNVRASTLPGPTEQNLVRVQRGEAELCITYTFQAYEVATGRGELKVPTPDLRHVMSVYGSYHMAVVQKNVPIQTLADLAKQPHRVWLGTKASVFWPLNIAAINAYGVTPEAIAKVGGVVNTAGYQNVLQAFQDSQVDVAFFAGPAPYSLMMQIDRAPGFRILSFDAEAGRKFTEQLPGTGVATIKGGTYQSQPDDVSVPYVFNQVVANAKAPDQLIYQITKTMMDTYKEFHALFPGATDMQPERALEYNKIPVHPGAERYYREVGLLK
jgi:uncharacterized protein